MRESLHPFIGFLSGWISLTVGFAAPTALAAMAFGAYLAPVAGLAGPTLPAAVLVLLATGLYLFKIQVGSGFLTFFTALKVATLLVVIGAAWMLQDPEPVQFAPAAGDLRLILSGPFAVSLIYVMYAYSGWNASTYIVNEVADPQRTIPRSLLLGTVSVTLLYAGANVAFLRAAPMQAMEGKVEVALVAARELFGQAGGDLLAILICIGLVSSVSALTWSGTRVGQMVGQDYRKLRFLSRTTVHGSPWVSVLLQSAVVLVLLATSSFESVAVYIQAVLILSSLLTVFGLVRLRHCQPDLPRPYRTWGYPVPPIIFGVMSLFMLFHVVRERPLETLWGAATLLAGVAVYLWVAPGHREDHGVADRPG